MILAICLSSGQRRDDSLPGRLGALTYTAGGILNFFMLLSSPIVTPIQSVGCLLSFGPGVPFSLMAFSQEIVRIFLKGPCCL